MKCFRLQSFSKYCYDAHKDPIYIYICIYIFCILPLKDTYLAEIGKIMFFSIRLKCFQTFVTTLFC